MTPDEIQFTPEQEERALIAMQRMRAHFLGFPALCTKAGCRKARKCSADPDICMDHMGPDVSEDEVFAKAPRELAAYCEWLGKVMDSRVQPNAMRRSQARKTPAALANS